MDSLISLIPSLIMLIIIPSFWMLCFKLSARLLRRRVITWKHSYILGFILTLISMVGNMLLSIVGIPLPLPLAFVFAFVLQVVIGAWFLSRRATYADGRELGWRGGAELTALSVFILTSVGMTWFVISSHLLPPVVQ